MSVDCQPDLTQLLKMKVTAVSSIFQSTDETVDDCAVPIFASTTAAYNLPKCSDLNLLVLLETHKQLLIPPPAELQLRNILFQQQVILLRYLYVELITILKYKNK